MNLEDATLVELRQLAKEKEIKNVSKLKKEELIEILEKLNHSSEVEEKTNNQKRFYTLVNE